MVLHWVSSLMVVILFSRETFAEYQYNFDLYVAFDTSVFVFRYNIPELAKKYKVYAVDLLGFGWSEKAIIDYDALIWRDQVVDFMKEVVKEPAILVGNRSA